MSIVYIDKSELKLYSYYVERGMQVSENSGPIGTADQAEYHGEKGVLRARIH